MKISAYAKINLALNVVRRREDGYHELEMVMAPLELNDEIDIELADHDEYHWNLESVIGENNTMVKAVEMMREQFQLKEHFQIHCLKRIPMEAGLAGGSADAAAVMRGINQLCQLNLSLEELSLLGKKIGADVPFCVINQCACVKGIGEKIETFEMPNDFDVLLVKPKKGVPTGTCFQQLNLKDCAHPDIEQVKQCLLKNDLDALSVIASNSLESSAFELVPEILTMKNDLIQAGFEFVLMSGSGSCVFACTKKKELLKEYMHRKQLYVDFICKTKILNGKKCKKQF